MVLVTAGVYIYFTLKNLCIASLRSKQMRCPITFPPRMSIIIIQCLVAGSLLDIIKHRMRTSDCKTGVLDETIIATVLKEVLKGLEYFHSNGQIHRSGPFLFHFLGAILPNEYKRRRICFPEISN